jgi:hypothetical protein
MVVVGGLVLAPVNLQPGRARGLQGHWRLCVIKSLHAARHCAVQ